ncbi:MAG: C39 family peptidase [Candidatus Uhrbacteria bacterium]
MRKLFSCLIILGLLVLFLGFLWSQRGSALDFVDDVQRRVEAPTPVAFSEVQKLENVESVKNAEDVEIVEIVENVDGGVGETNEISLPEENDPTPTDKSTISTPSTISTDLPAEFNLAVPFTSQTPLGNWDVVHEETCEEAALYMIHKFYEGETADKIDPETAETDLMKIVEFEKALFGFFESTTATQIAVLAEQMYGYERAEVVTDPTIEDLKKFIAAGYPVIVPSAGRLLGNPNFSGEGPLYHALVLKGYTDTTFITNDPGTRRGSDYQYDFATIMNAMHDWNDGDVLNGAKVVVVVYPNE